MYVTILSNVRKESLDILEFCGMMINCGPSVHIGYSLTVFPFLDTPITSLLGAESFWRRNQSSS
jgi:hypothetical protein